MAKNVLKFADKVAILNHIKTVTTSPMPGFVEYIEGHNDATVAAVFKCTIHNVIGIREPLCGKLVQPRTLAPAAMIELDTRLSAIEKWLDAYDATWRNRLL